MKKHRYGQQAGFSAIELLMVIVIMGILVGIAAVKFVGMGKRAQIAATRMSIENIGTAVEMFETENGGFPSSLKQLTLATEERGPLMEEESLVDSWGNEFQYKQVAQFEYEIRSAGPDGQMGTEDDLVN